MSWALKFFKNLKFASKTPKMWLIPIFKTQYPISLNLRRRHSFPLQNYQCIRSSKYASVWTFCLCLFWKGCVIIQAICQNNIRDHQPSGFTDNIIQNMYKRKGKWEKKIQFPADLLFNILSFFVYMQLFVIFFVQKNE